MADPQVDEPQVKKWRRPGATLRRIATERVEGALAKIPEKRRTFLTCIWKELDDDNVAMWSAGLAFYGLLSIFPALAAFLSIYGLVAEETDVREQLSAFYLVLPPEALSLLEGQMLEIASAADPSLNFGLVGGLLLSIWSAMRGVKNLILACNAVYDQGESRGLVKLNLLAFLLTLGALIGGLVAIVALVVVPPYLARWAPEVPALQALIRMLRWPLLAAVWIFALRVLYTLAPNRERRRWKWVTWGSTIATLTWLLGSMGFSFYVENFASYNKTYGTVGGVIALMTWLYLSAYLILLGAEIDAEIERRALADSSR